MIQMLYLSHLYVTAYNKSLLIIRLIKRDVKRLKSELLEVYKNHLNV